MSALTPSFEFGPVRIYAGEKSGKYPDGNQVIVQGSQRRAVFDSPLVANRIGTDFDGADLVIQGHVHEDHMAGLHRLPHAPVHVHSQDLPAMQSWHGLRAAYGYQDELSADLRKAIERDFYYVPRPDATGYEHGSQWDLGGGVLVRAIHCPGHTAGHCVLLVEPVGLAFIGDIDLSGFGPYYGDASSNLGDFRATLEHLTDIPAQIWVTSHHRGVYTDRDAFVEDLAAFKQKIQQREQHLLDLLREGTRRLDELVAVGLLYAPDADIPWRECAERRSISQHLDELLDARVISMDAAGNYSVTG